MSGKRLTMHLIFAAAVAVAFNLLIFVISRHSLPRQLLKHIEETPEIDGLFLGNSVVEAGVDPDAFQSHWPDATHPVSVMNAGLGASGPVEHCLLLRNALAKHPETRFVVYGFGDFQLTTQTPGGWSDVVGNRAMSYYVEPAFAARLYGASTGLDRWRFQWAGQIPMVTERYAIWAKIEKARRYAAGMGLPGQRQNRFGRAADFNLLEAASVAEFTQESRQTIQRQAPLIAAIQEILRSARERQAEVVFVEMPMPQRHRQLFYETEAWRDYRAYLQPLIQHQGGHYLAANDWVTDERRFADALHLDEAGARDFSQRLAQTLALLLRD